MHHAIRTMSLSEYILKQSETGWNDKDLPIVADIIHQEIISLGPVLDDHLKIHLHELTKTEAFIARKYQHTLIVVAMASVVVIILTFIIVMAMMRAVLGPVKILQEGTQQISRGNIDIQMKINTGDEFEYLALEFRKMAEKLSEYHSDLDRKVKERTQALHDANVEFQRAEEQVHNLSQELLKIQETERQKIALDLHDNVAQELSSLKVAGESMLNDVSAGKTPLSQEVNDWVKLLGRCIKTVRELSYNLRPPGIEQMGVISAVRDFCRNFEKQYDLHIDFSAVGLENLRLEYEYAINIYRLIQEALNNIQKHSQATTAKVRLISSHPNLIMRIEDNGSGFDLQEKIETAYKDNRLGLLGMRERVRMLGGSFSIKSAPGKGTRVFVEIPLNSVNKSHEKNSDRR